MRRKQPLSCPLFLDEKKIFAIIENRNDDLIYKKAQIELFFLSHPDEAERAEYLRSAYQDRFTEILADGARLGYRPQKNGLLMWEGAYLSRYQRKRFFMEAGGRLYGTAH